MAKLLIIAVIALVLTIACFPPGYPTVGGTPVPWDMHCQEDEGIMFVGVPDTLVCQTIDDLFEEEFQEEGSTQHGNSEATTSDNEHGEASVRAREGSRRPRYGGGHRR